MENKKELTNEMLGDLFSGSVLVDGQKNNLVDGIDKAPSSETVNSGDTVIQEGPTVNVNVSVEQNAVQKDVEKTVNGILATTSNPAELKKSSTTQFQGNGNNQFIPSGGYPNELTDINGIPLDRNPIKPSANGIDSNVVAQSANDVALQNGQSGAFTSSVVNREPTTGSGIKSIFDQLNPVASKKY
jgi:hypothetical protein